MDFYKTFTFKSISIVNVTILISFLLFSWLLFANLSDHALWNDEAVMGVLARNVLDFGYPRTFDGLNLLYPDSPEQNKTRTYIYIVNPWLPIYVIATSFKLFGISTWSARVPFIIAGFFTLIILYVFCFRYMKSKGIGFLSILLLGTSVPFLLHMRQARYYGLVIFLSLAIFYLYHRIIQEGRGYFWLGFTASILSLTNYATFVPIFSSIWLIALFMDRHKIQWKKFIGISILPVCTFLAWVAFSCVGIGMPDPTAFPIHSSLLEIKKNFEFQIRTINGYFAPVAFWIVILILLRHFKKYPIIKPSEDEKGIFKRIAIIIGCNIIFFSVVGMRTMRYYIQYLPFLYLVEAFLLFRIFKWKKILAIIILILIIFTNFLARPNPLFLTRFLPERFDFSRYSKFRIYFLDYLYELTHRYTGPLEALCDYLDLHSKPGESIKIVKGDATVLFYHPELVILNDARYFKKSYPEWIVIRRYWNPIFEDIWRKKPDVEIEEGYLAVLDRYNRIPLLAIDSIRENEPDNLETHFFRTPDITPENQMFVYRLKETRE